MLCYLQNQNTLCNKLCQSNSKTFHVCKAKELHTHEDVGNDKVSTGLLIGHKKIIPTFVGFAESNLQKNSQFHTEFAEIFGANFSEKWSVKNSWFHGNFLGIFQWKRIGFALIWWTFSTKKDSNLTIFPKMTSSSLYNSNRKHWVLTSVVFIIPVILQENLNNSFRLSYVFVFVWPWGSVWQRSSLFCLRRQWVLSFSKH